MYLYVDLMCTRRLNRDCLYIVEEDMKNFVKTVMNVGTSVHICAVVYTYIELPLTLALSPSLLLSHFPSLPSSFTPILPSLPPSHVHPPYFPPSLPLYRAPPLGFVSIVSTQCPTMKDNSFICWPLTTAVTAAAMMMNHTAISPSAQQSEL